jgi:hypothetical protein
VNERSLRRFWRGVLDRSPVLVDASQVMSRRSSLPLSLSHKCTDMSVTFGGSALSTAHFAPNTPATTTVFLGSADVLAPVIRYAVCHAGP